MKLLLAATHHPVSSPRFMADAFKRIGVDVRHIGGPVEHEHVPERYWWQPDAYYETAFWPDWTPDLVLYMDTAHKPWVSSYPDVPHAVYCTCNNVCNMTMDTMQHYFVAAHDGPVWPVQGDNMTWLPNAYDPTLHTSSPIPYKEREYDVCCVGAIYPERRAILDAMQAAGLKVFVHDKLYFDEYVAAYHNSRIGLCYSPQSSAMFRIFETAAMGCVVLSNVIKDYEYLHPKGVAHFTDSIPKTDPITRAKVFIDHPYLGEYFIKEALEWVKPHTWDNRAQQIVDWYNSNGF